MLFPLGRSVLLRWAGSPLFVINMVMDLFGCSQVLKNQKKNIFFASKLVLSWFLFCDAPRQSLLPVGAHCEGIVYTPSVWPKALADVSHASKNVVFVHFAMTEAGRDLAVPYLLLLPRWAINSIQFNSILTAIDEKGRLNHSCTTHHHTHSPSPFEL